MNTEQENPLPEGSLENERKARDYAMNYRGNIDAATRRAVYATHLAFLERQSTRIVVGTDGQHSPSESERCKHVIGFVDRRGIRMRFGLCVMREGESGRRETMGPLVPGPWVDTYPLCTVIDNHGGSKRESDERRAAGLEHDAAPGTLVVVDGYEYIARAEPNYGYLKLVPRATDDRNQRLHAALLEASEDDLRWYRDELYRRIQQRWSRPLARIDADDAAEQIRVVDAVARERKINLSVKTGVTA